MKRLLTISIIYWLFAADILAQAPQGNEGGRPAPIIPGQEEGKGKGELSGILRDSTTGEPVMYATITLNNAANNNPVNGTVTDEKGKFSLNKIEAGNYNIVFSFLGYNDKTLSNIAINEKTDLNLGTVQLTPSVLKLKEVTVTGQKPLIEEKVDRTVYNAENDATNKGGDATDVLRKVPMLSVDLDGNVSLRGNQNIRVLINGKPSSIAANSVSDALKQIPADLIKNVEVITSPSAKYDAEGSAGIINIITKKNTLNGFSLNLDGSAGIRGSSLGLNGSYRKGKMGFSLGGYGRLGYNIPGQFINNQTTINQDQTVSTIIQNANTRNLYGFGQYTLGWDYDISKNNSLSASVKYGFRNMHNYQDKLTTQTYHQYALQNIGVRNVDVADLSGTVDASLNFTHQFEKPQREFSIMTLYSRNDRSNNFQNQILNSEGDSTVSRLKNQNQSYNQESTIQLDYQSSVGKSQLVELGAKNIYRQVSSSYSYYRAAGVSDPYIPLSTDTLSNTFNYNQNVSAAYLSYTLNLPKSYTVKAGGRYEYTYIQASYQNEKKLNIPSYSILVPSVNLSKKLTNGGTVKASFNRRIQRPSLQYLNPNLQASNPLNVTIGNPNLRPEFTNNYELSYSTYIKGISLTVAGFMRNTQGAIQSVRDIKGTDTVRTTYQNIGSQNAYGFNIFTNIIVSNKFSFNGGPDFYYALLKNNVPDPLYNASNHGWVWSGRVSANYNLTNTWTLQMFAFYRGKQVQLQGYQGTFYIYSLSLKKDFKDKKASIGFGAENFFTSSMRIPTVLNSPVVSQNSVNVLHNMNFKINFSYKIGKLNADDKKPKRKKSVNNDDLKEGGGDTMQGAGGQMSGGGAPGNQEGGGGQRPPGGGGGQAPGQNNQGQNNQGQNNQFKK